MDPVIARLNKFEENLVGLSLLGLALLTCLETFLRYAVNYTFTWFQEFSNYMIIFTTFLGASIGVKYGSHFSMDALVQYIPDKACHLVKSIAYFVAKWRPGRSSSTQHQPGFGNRNEFSLPRDKSTHLFVFELGRQKLFAVIYGNTGIGSDKNQSPMAGNGIGIIIDQTVKR